MHNLISRTHTSSTSSCGISASIIPRSSPKAAIMPCSDLRSECYGKRGFPDQMAIQQLSLTLTPSQTLARDAMRLVAMLYTIDPIPVSSLSLLHTHTHIGSLPSLPAFTHTCDMPSYCRTNVIECNSFVTI